MARILIIDDDRLVRDTIRVIFEFEGHEVVLARDGREGIAAFGSGQFDLVICDILAPDKAGVETIKQIRDFSAVMPIIAMTGGFAQALHDRVDSDLRDIAGQSGVLLTLAKPFRREELMALVQRCLG